MDEPISNAVELLIRIDERVRSGFTNSEKAQGDLKRDIGELKERDNKQEHRIDGLAQGMVAMTSVAEDVRTLKTTVEKHDRQFVALEGTKKGAIGAWEIAKQIGLVIAGALALLGVQLAVQPKHQPTVERSRATMEHVQPAAPIQHR